MDGSIGRLECELLSDIFFLEVDGAKLCGQIKFRLKLLKVQKVFRFAGRPMTFGELVWRVQTEETIKFEKKLAQNWEDFLSLESSIEAIVENCHLGEQD